MVKFSWNKRTHFSFKKISASFWMTIDIFWMNSVTKAFSSFRKPLLLWCEHYLPSFCLTFLSKFHHIVSDEKSFSFSGDKNIITFFFGLFPFLYVKISVFFVFDLSALRFIEEDAFILLFTKKYFWLFIWIMFVLHF